MEPSPRRRSRGLRPIRGFLSLVIFLDILGLVISVLNWLGGGRRLVMFRIATYDMYGPQSPASKPAFGRFDVQEVLASVRDPSLPQRLLEEVAGGTVWAVITLVIAVLARRIVNAAMHSDPFTVAMAGRLQRLGLVVLIGGAAAELTNIAAGMALYHSADPHGSPFYALNVPLSFWWLPLGFALLAFSAVVRHGCTLRAELDQVI